MKSNANPFLASRWRLFSFILLLGLTSILVGCGKKPDEQTQEKVQPQSSELCLFSWDEYLDQKLLDEFKERTGIQVNVKIFQSSDEMVEGLKSEPGTYDVLICEDGYVPILAEKRMLCPVDRKKLTNWENLDPNRINPAFDPENKFSVPYLWGTTLLAYRRDLLQAPKHSWSVIFEDRLKDKVGFLDDRMECYAGILRTMNIQVADAKPEEIEEAAKKLQMMVRDRGMRLGGLSGNEVKKYLLEGSCWISMIYSGDAARIANENPDIPISYFIPEEGATVWMDSFCISRDSRKVETAHKFLNFMLEAKIAAASANFLRYASPNKAAFPYIDSNLLNDETINPKPAILAKCEFFNLKNLDSLRMVNVGWRRVQEAWQGRNGQASNAAPDEVDAQRTIE
jgi:spermidine/putrescine transport system substrate-binding protein